MSSGVVDISLTSPNVPDLTLIDLPGNTCQHVVYRVVYTDIQYALKVFICLYIYICINSGIVRSTTDDQDDSIITQVSDLVESYLSQPRTIILAVLASNVDAATQVSYYLYIYINTSMHA